MTTSIFRPYGGGSKPALISQGYPVMTNLTIEKIAKTNADALTKSGQAAEAIMKGRTEALTESGNASRTAYQELATKNAKNLTAAISGAFRREKPGAVRRIAAEPDQRRRRSRCQRLPPHSPIDHFRVHCRFRACEKADRGDAEDRADLGPAAKEVVLG